ncbi:hypothetical protein SNOG_00528 [Parastagonospora nodorum SN15]|uniref:Uncharacterized protein n=1 Tax=Phaeosphaeria nodorum (strain SN15 / ATCC MYA-4574 / FGSC 10173) TaxID=321614 RepID=Q0V636_PHANO|nr:hypothetical protein SNOG_00528 [Parastagonospora nodorum SN15]EAT92023.2 hypothetical protein SNOG_00528 [Parastagonospora nodorum SN15]
MTRTWSKIMLAPKDTGRRLLKCSHDIKMHKRTLSSFAFNISKTSTCLKPIQFRYTIGVDHTRVSYDVQQTPSVYTLVKDCVMIITCLCHTTVHIRMFVNAPRAYANHKHQNRAGSKFSGGVGLTVQQRMMIDESARRKLRSRRLALTKTTSEASNLNQQCDN